jgi:hypothetical protein
MRRGDQSLLDEGFGRGDVDPVDVGARRHKADHRSVRQAHDTRNEFSLTALKHPCCFRLGNQGLDFFVSDSVFCLGREFKYAKYEAR